MLHYYINTAVTSGAASVYVLAFKYSFAPFQRRNILTNYVLILKLLKVMMNLTVGTWSAAVICS